MFRVVLEVAGVNVEPINVVRYLGVWLDTKLKFYCHIKKSEKSITALSRILPNVGGQITSKGQLYSNVVQSQLLYSAPVWYGVLSNQKLLTKLVSTQRKMQIRVCSAYKTISAEAPIDLLIEKRKARYCGVEENFAGESLIG